MSCVTCISLAEHVTRTTDAVGCESTHNANCNVKLSLHSLTRSVTDQRRSGLICAAICRLDYARDTIKVTTTMLLCMMHSLEWKTGFCSKDKTGTQTTDAVGSASTHNANCHVSISPHSLTRRATDQRWSGLICAAIPRQDDARDTIKVNNRTAFVQATFPRVGNRSSFVIQKVTQTTGAVPSP